MPGTSTARSRRLRRVAIVAAAACLSLGLLAASAPAAYHLMKIREVHEGGASGDYVELQMYASGQNFISGHYLETYDGAGNPFQTFQFTLNVPNGQSQRSILIASAPTVGGVAADFVTPAANLLVGAGGSACFIDTLPSNGIDCVAWGTTAPPIPNPSPVGTPVLFGGALGVGQSIERSIARGCGTLLEAGDDTNNSAADFTLAPPSPRNNATAPTERPCVPPNQLRCRGRTATLVGTAGRDDIKGTSQADVIVALGGGDKVSGRGGRDLICGDTGKDRLFGGAGKDRLLGEQGKDRVFGGAGKDRLYGNAAKDKLFGGAAKDKLYGGASKDRLFGGASRDRLFGQKGKDSLFGGAARDFCNGGASKDRGKSCERERRV